MGIDVTCIGTLGNESAEGRAQLETDFIQFRSERFRFKIPLKELSRVRTDGEALAFESNGKEARLELGSKAANRWVDKILNPPSLLDKLGVKPGTTVYWEGRSEASFKKLRKASVTEADLVFLAAPDMATLLKAPEFARRMRRDAALWIVYPKGRTEIREMDVLRAGRASGLKDVKVIRFSEAETALKFVVPVMARK